jgi:hypothetical protein
VRGLHLAVVLIFGSPSYFPRSRDSIIGIGTHYGLDDPDIESWWGGGGRDFPRPSIPALEPTQPPIQWAPGLSWV